MALALFLCTKKLRKMKVTINNEHGLNMVVASAVMRAFSKRLQISMQFGCSTICVPDFPTFLECMWDGFCKCSRFSLGEQMRRVYDVSVYMDDGTMYGVWIRYDEKTGGIRYGSIC